MRLIKSIRIYLLLILFFNINCKNSDNKNIQTEFAKNDTVSLGSNDTVISVSNVGEIKIESNSYFFNKVFKKQIFSLNVEKTDIENEFKDKKIEINKNILIFSDCSTEIRIKNDKAKNYLNGQQNVEIYNDILSELNFKLTDDIEYIVPLYPDNKCGLPSDNFFVLDKNNIFFVYKGYLILYTKSLNSEPKNDTSEKIICSEQKGNMEDGFITNCFINEDMQKAYEIFISESKINEIDYLKRKLPIEDIKYTLNEAEVSYINKKNILSIQLFFPGGETFIIFNSNNNKTEITIKNFPQ